MFQQILIATMFWQTPAATDPNNGNVVYLVEKGHCENGRCFPDRVVGHWDLRKHGYWQLVDNKWQGPVDPPIKPPEDKTLASKPDRPTGVDKVKLKDSPAYSRKDRTISREDAYEAMIHDDSSKRRLTIIGTPEQQNLALASLPETVDALVWTAEPSHWSVKNFHAAGAPTIVLQDPGGKIVARAESVPADFKKFLAGDEKHDVPYSWLAILTGFLLLIFRRK